MKQLLTIFIALTILTSCGHNIDQKTIENLDKYKTATKVLLDNFENIKKAVNYQYYDSVRQVHYSTIINANKYYFENTVSKDNDEIKQLLTHWDELIYNDKVFGTLFLNKDSVVVFTTYYKNGIFSGVGHYVVFDPTDRKGGLGQRGNEILKEKPLDKHWTYIIEKKYYWND